MSDGPTYAYLRVSTFDQDHGVDAQKAAIGRVVDVDEWIEERASGKDMTGRPLFQDLLERACAEGATIVVSKLDRLGRSVVDVLNVFEQVHKCGGGIKVLDMGIDTTTPAGKLMLTILAGFAEFERQMISLRTKEGLAAARDKGVRLGAPSKLTEEDKRAIITKRVLGVPADTIAAEFGVSTRTVYRVSNWDARP